MSKEKYPMIEKLKKKKKENKYVEDIFLLYNYKIGII